MLLDELWSWHVHTPTIPSSSTLKIVENQLHWFLSGWNCRVSFPAPAIMKQCQFWKLTAWKPCVGASIGGGDIGGGVAGLDGKGKSVATSTPGKGLISCTSGIGLVSCVDSKRPLPAKGSTENLRLYCTQKQQQ